MTLAIRKTASNYPKTKSSAVFKRPTYPSPSLLGTLPNSLISA